MKHSKWDPLAWVFNWGGTTAFVVAFATMCLMNMWQGA